MSKGADLKTIMVIMIAPLCWAGNFVLARHLGGAISPIQLNFWRWTIAALTLTPLIASQIPYVIRIVKEKPLALMIQAATGIAIYHYLVYKALGLTTAINATLINSLVPVFIPIVARLAFGWKIQFGHVIAILISTAGVAFVGLKGSMKNFALSDFNLGDLLMVSAAMVWAIYTVSLTKKPVEIGGLGFLWVIAVLGSLMTLPFYSVDVYRNGSFSLDSANVITVLYVAWFAGIVAFLAWNYGSTKLPPAHLGMFAHLIPVFGSIMAVVFLREDFHIYHAIGIFLVAIGLLMAFRISPKASSAVPATHQKAS